MSQLSGFSRAQLILSQVFRASKWERVEHVPNTAPVLSLTPRLAFQLGFGKVANFLPGFWGMEDPSSVGRMRRAEGEARGSQFRWLRTICRPGQDLERDGHA